ncbi:hypothetical protein HW532_15150 [Kaustia mangrovi]|uniref:Uncharacterized protein n=1 Tax=Kaustia mangrovi TaxID=2593653 RepID=A0A7S8C5R5_9HYPH|nr:hypothetical protein [Kaustia mangrovi]QPC43907.1 hypothetical protein HW532_15150 [Kaustia mangrovi]
MTKNTVFIHTNAKQMVGALVAAHSLKRNSARPDAFDVKIIAREDFDFFDAYEGRTFLRAGSERHWRNDDLQSFTPLRFMPPKLMGYEGRAVVIDPDIFAVGDITELLERDMEGKAIFARPRPGHNGREDYVASSVMLLDCARLRHWDCEADFEALFRKERDYEDWIILAYEPRETLGALETVWNDFDRLAPDTRLLHNTKRRTQPWKTGLPVDFTNRLKSRWLSKLVGDNGIRLPGRYRAHPDRNQERFFFALLRECVATGQVSEDYLKSEIEQRHIRPDALSQLASAPALEEIRPV